LSEWIGTKLDSGAKDYLKDMGAATASNGAVGLYHVANLTPEAAAQGEKLIAKNAKTYIIDDAELERVKKSYPVIWKNPAASPKLCFIGCPHLSSSQLEFWTTRLLAALESSGRTKIAIPVVFTAAPAVLKEFQKGQSFKSLLKAGVITSDICPLMYMNNPLCGKMPVITNSNKLRTYTSARYYTDDEILSIISGANGGLTK
jgi:predicted aconitase